MDQEDTIRHYKAQLEKVVLALAELEELRELQKVSGGRIKSNRGRKSMSNDERLEVSGRMKKYWANKRGGKPKE
jgi:hypothetical protein